jgi:hypothetical protein
MLLFILCLHFNSKYGTLLLTTTKEAILASTESDTTTDDSNDTAEQQQLSFYSFPTLSQLNAATEQELRDLGIILILSCKLSAKILYSLMN